MALEKLSILITAEIDAPGYSTAAIWYVAECIEHYFIVQSSTLDSLLTKGLPEFIGPLIAVRGPTQLPAPAPDEVRAKFEASIVRLELVSGVWMTPGMPKLEIRFYR